MPTHSSFHANAARNRGLACRLPSCHIGRVAVSPYCGRHAKAVERYGHPLGHALNPKKDYGVERELVAAFIGKHSSHPGVLSALQWLDGWLKASDLGEQVPGRAEMQRLSANAVSPLSILTEAAALFLFSRWNPRRLPDDERLTFAIGVRVLCLAPREKRYGTLKGKPRLFSGPIGKVARREVGKRIRLTLAGLLVNIAEGITAEQGQQQQFIQSLHKPFPSTT